MMKWRNLLRNLSEKKRTPRAALLKQDELAEDDPTLRRIKPEGNPVHFSVSKYGTPMETTKMIPHTNSVSRAHWVFEVISGAERGRQFIGMTNEIKVGRQFDNHIQLNDPKVSRFHAVIVRKGTALFVRDLNSTNGTWVNQMKVSKAQKLESGDQIRIGATVIAVHFEKE